MALGAASLPTEPRNMTVSAASNPHDPFIGATFQPTQKTRWVNITPIVQEMLRAENSGRAPESGLEPL